MRPHRTTKAQPKKAKEEYPYFSDIYPKRRIQANKDKRSNDYSILLNRHLDRKIEEMGAVDYIILIIEYLKQEHPTIHVCVDSAPRWTIDCLSEHFAQYHVHIDDAIVLVRKIMRRGQ